MNHRRGWDPIVVAMAGVTVAASVVTSAAGETITLHPGGGPASQVQDAVEVAEAGDVIRLAAGTWTWDVDLGPIDLLGKSITLEGDADGGTIVSLESKPESVPTIVAMSGEDAACRIRHLRFVGGHQATGRVIEVVGASPTVEGCGFTAFAAVEHPLISVSDGGLLIEACDFVDNQPAASTLVSAVHATLGISGTTFVDCGGAGTILADQVMIEIEDCLFERSEAGPVIEGAMIDLSGCCGSLVDNVFRGLAGDWLTWDASAISIRTADVPAEDFCLSISDCTFDDLIFRNIGTTIATSVPIVITGSSFHRCRAPGASGGAVDLFTGGVIAACEFTDCSASNGGAVAARGSTVLWGCSFQGNSASKGGGVFSAHDRLLLLDCDFVANTASDGGAVWTSLNDRAPIPVDSPVSLYGCLFEDNRSSRAGGAIFLGYEIGQALVERCRFRNNLDPDGDPEAFGHPDEDETWERYEVLVADTTFCPSLGSSRRYMTDLGGNLVDIKCEGDDIDSVMIAVGGRPFVWWYNDFFGWLRRQFGGNQIQLFNPATGGMEPYFSTGLDWTVAPKIDAFARVDQRRLLMSFAATGRPDELEDAPENAVVGADILMFTATEFGQIAEGRWTFHFDGSDVGLTGSAANIDALEIEPDGSLLISLKGSIQLEGLGRVDDADVIRFRPESLGSDTRGTWERVLDTDYSGFTGAGEDIDALAVIGSDASFTSLAISSSGNFTVGDFVADDEDVLGFIWYPELESAPPISMSKIFDGLDDLGFSVRKADISALEWIGEW